MLVWELIDALGNSQLNKVFALLGWGGVIDDVVVFHQNVSNVPGVLFDFIRLEDTKVALVGGPTNMLSGDHEFSQVNFELKGNPRIITESENLLGHVKKVLDMVARMFKIACSSWLIVANDLLSSVIGGDISLPLEIVRLWEVDIRERRFKNGIGTLILGLQSDTRDGCEGPELNGPRSLVSCFHHF